MSSRNKKIAIIVIVVALLAGGAAALVVNKKNDDKQKEAAKSNVEGQLDRENRQNNQNKNDDKQSNQNGNSTSGSTDKPTNKVAANPVLSRWDTQNGTLEAAGFIQGAFEDGGTCTFKLTNGSATITRTSTGFKDATTTVCPPVQVSTSELTGGSWTIQLSYDSPTATGSSSKHNVNVQ